MKKLKSRILIQSKEVADAIVNFTFDPVVDKDQYYDLNLNLALTDLDKSGLPKATLAKAANGSDLVPTMYDPFETSKVEVTKLKDGRFFIHKDPVKHLWDYMIRAHDAGGLKIGKTPRSVKVDGSDFIPLPESFNKALDAEIDLPPDTE